MRYRRGWIVLPCLGLAFVGIVPAVVAGPAIAQKTPRSVTLTQAEAVRLVLTQWEDVGHSAETLYVRLNRYCYDQVFEREKRCAGQFLIDRDGQWVLELERVRIGVDQKSNRKGASGQPYELRSDDPSVLVCQRKAWIRLSPDQGTYLKYTGNLPSTEDWLRQWQAKGHSLGESFIGFGCLHFDYFFRRTLLRPVQADLLSRFDFRILKSEGTRVWLDMQPKSGGFDAENFSTLQVIFERQVGRPVAARCVFPGGMELVYLFNEFETDVPILRSQDPFNPDLSAYKGETTVLGAK
jgi:hypothetical protein